MWRHVEKTGRGRRAGAAAPAAALLAALLFSWPADVALAAEVTAGEPAVAEREALAETIGERYRVLPTRQGLLLEPREEVPGIQTVEIAGGEVAINGEPVAATILRSWLGREAEPLLDMAALPEDEARALFAAEQAAPPDELPEAAAPEAETGDEPAELAPIEEEEEDGRVHLGERVIFGRGLTIEEGEVASEVVVIGGVVHIRGRVDGGVVAVGGPVIVEGRVRGDLVAVGSGVELGPDGSIGGDVVSVGSTVRARESQIGGDIVQIGIPWAWDGGGWEPRWGPRGSPVRAWAARDAVGNVAVILLLGLMTAFLLLVARGPVERAAQVIARHPGSALASGFAMWIFQLIGIWLLLVLLVVTIVGCLAVPLIPVLWLFGWLLYLPGYAAAALATGRWLTGRFGWSLGGAYGSALAGVLAIEIVKLLGNVLSIAGGPLAVMAMLIELMGVLIVLLAWTVGVGAILMNLLNRRRTQPLPPGALPPGTTPGPAGPPSFPAGGATTTATAPLHGHPPAAPAHPAAPPPEPDPASPEPPPPTAPEPPPPEPEAPPRDRDKVE